LCWGPWGIIRWDLHTKMVKIRRIKNKKRQNSEKDWNSWEVSHFTHHLPFPWFFFCLFLHTTLENLNKCW
jgi:hypothetical protein